MRRPEDVGSTGAPQDWNPKKTKIFLIRSVFTLFSLQCYSHYPPVSIDTFFPKLAMLKAGTCRKLG
jgi:hypothetical protein